eukprot:COSAG05_NODE_1240_length_5422_cov_6.791283_5_plen_169_part_00
MLDIESPLTTHGAVAGITGERAGRVQQQQRRRRQQGEPQSVAELYHGQGEDMEAESLRLLQGLEETIQDRVPVCALPPPPLRLCPLLSLSRSGSLSLCLRLCISLSLALALALSGLSHSLSRSFSLSLALALALSLSLSLSLSAWVRGCVGVWVALSLLMSPSPTNPS